ncbi:MAG TPA: hypothetical protein VII60_09285 [Acidimicrobiales bacterium]
MTRRASSEIVKKDLSDVGAGLAVAIGSTILLKLLSRRGRIVRTVALASVAAATTFVRNRVFANHKTTTYSLSRDVDRNPAAGDHLV